MARLPQPAALWVGYTVFRLVAVVFMLWCLISQFISLADEMKMLNQFATVQGGSTLILPASLNSTASSNDGTTSPTKHSGSSSTSSISSATKIEFSTAYSSFSVTSATTRTQVSTIPPSSRPTGVAPDPATGSGGSVSSSGGSSSEDLPPGVGGETAESESGVGSGVSGVSGAGSTSSSGASSGGSSSPLIGGEALKRRRWQRRSRESELAAFGPNGAMAVVNDGAPSQDIVRTGRLSRRADDAEKTGDGKQASKSDGGWKNGTETAEGGVIGPWRPEGPAFAALSRIILAGLLGLLVAAQLGVPEVWLYEHVGALGPQSTPILLGAAQFFVAVETLRAPGKTLNLLGAWGVMGIGCFNMVSGICLWFRARALPPNPPPALWFSHAVRLLYSRPLPPFYAPLFRTQPSVPEDDIDKWDQDELEHAGGEVEEGKTAQNTLANSQMGSTGDVEEGKTMADPRSVQAMASTERQASRKSKSRQKAPGQTVSSGLLSDIALGPTSAQGGGMLGTHTLNSSGGGADAHPMTRYDAPPSAHMDVRQGGYPTFTGAGIGQAGRQVPAGALRLDSKGNVIGLELEEPEVEEEVAVVKMAERVSVYGSGVSGSGSGSSSSARRVRGSRDPRQRVREDRGKPGKDGRDGRDRRARRDPTPDGGKGSLDEARPETVHSLLPPVTLLPSARNGHVPGMPAVPGARRNPTGGASRAEGHRRTPSIGKQGMTPEGIHRLSDPANNQKRPDLAHTNSVSSVGSGYSGLAYDRAPRTDRQLPEVPRVSDHDRAQRFADRRERSGQRTGQETSNYAVKSPVDAEGEAAVAPKTPLLTPSPSPMTPAQVAQARTGTIHAAGQYTFPAARPHQQHREDAAVSQTKNRSKRGTIVGRGFVRPVELDMSDSESDEGGQGGLGAPTDAEGGSKSRDRRASSLENEIMDLLSPPLTRSPVPAGMAASAEGAHGRSASRKSILPPGSLSQHIQAIEQQQLQQKQIALSAESGSIRSALTPASSTASSSSTIREKGTTKSGSELVHDPDRPPSALKGAKSNLTPPRTRPPRHLRFALSPIPGTPVSADAAAASAERSASSRAKGSKRGNGGGRDEVASPRKSKSDQSKSKAASSSSSTSTQRDIHDDGGSVGLTVPGLGLELTLPAGLVGGISPALSSAPPGGTFEEMQGSTERPRTSERGQGYEGRERRERGARSRTSVLY